MVGERGLPGSASLPCGPLLKQRLSRCARLKPPAEVLILFCYRRKKTCLFRQVSKNGQRERITWLCEPALRAVAEATLSRCARLKPPSEVLILFCYKRKKTCLFRQVSKMVGERGFEPPTHWSQTSCATKLRYSPIFLTVLPGAKRGT